MAIHSHKLVFLPSSVSYTAGLASLFSCPDLSYPSPSIGEHLPTIQQAQNLQPSRHVFKVLLSQDLLFQRTPILPNSRELRLAESTGIPVGIA